MMLSVSDFTRVRNAFNVSSICACVVYKSCETINLMFILTVPNCCGQMKTVGSGTYGLIFNLLCRVCSCKYKFVVVCRFSSWH